MSLLTGKQFLPLYPTLQFRAKSHHLSHHVFTPVTTNVNLRTTLKLSAKQDDSPAPLTAQDQVNLSVLRFTFGISWLDESYLPRYIGYGFGSLILLNHFVGSTSPVTSAQLISEALGISLAAFSITLPYVGRFLKGATLEEQTPLPERAQQMFLLSERVPDGLREDLAWATYILLRNTKSVSVLVYLRDVICIRGYWRIPDNLSKDEILIWFVDQIKKSGLSDTKGTLYFPQSTDTMLEEALADKTSSILVQPVLGNGDDKIEGFVLVASSISYAYSDKDRSWVTAISNKFRGESTDIGVVS